MYNIHPDHAPVLTREQCDRVADRFFELKSANPGGCTDKMILEALKSERVVDPIAIREAKTEVWSVVLRRMRIESVDKRQAAADERERRMRLH